MTRFYVDKDEDGVKLRFECMFDRRVVILCGYCLNLIAMLDDIKTGDKCPKCGAVVEEQHYDLPT